MNLAFVGEIFVLLYVSDMEFLSIHDLENMFGLVVTFYNFADSEYLHKAIIQSSRAAGNRQMIYLERPREAYHVVVWQS